MSSTETPGFVFMGTRGVEAGLSFLQSPSAKRIAESLGNKAFQSCTLICSDWQKMEDIKVQANLIPEDNIFFIKYPSDGVWNISNSIYDEILDNAILPVLEIFREARISECLFSGSLAEGLVGALLFGFCNEMKEDFRKIENGLIMGIPLHGSQGAIGTYNTLLSFKLTLNEIFGLCFMIDEGIGKDVWSDGVPKLISLLTQDTEVDRLSAVSLSELRKFLSIFDHLKYIIPTFFDSQMIGSRRRRISLQEYFDVLSAGAMLGNPYNKDSTTLGDVVVATGTKQNLRNLNQLNNAIGKMLRRSPFISSNSRLFSGGGIFNSVFHFQNSTLIGQILDQLVKSFNLMYNSQAYLHQYRSYGISDSHFQSAREMTQTIIDAYCECE